MPATGPAAARTNWMAAASASSAKATRSMAAGTLGTATANTVSPSKLVWTARSPGPCRRGPARRPGGPPRLGQGGVGRDQGQGGAAAGRDRLGPDLAVGGRRGQPLAQGGPGPARTGGPRRARPVLVEHVAAGVDGGQGADRDRPGLEHRPAEPALGHVSGPAVLPTVAPIPAPTLPSGPSAVEAARQAASPSAGPGRASQSPTIRSNSTGPQGTIGIGRPKRP